jgi:3-oxoacyl-[acyl-carrier protein] reductase
MRLQNRVAIVTGGSRGIGRAICLAFAKEGASAVVNYLGSEAEARDTVAQIAELGRKAVAVRADVGESREVAHMVSQAVETFGRIDVLVNNAGVLLPFDFAAPDYENWQRMVDVNIKGILLCSQAVADHMVRQKGGRIVNIVVKETRGSLDYIMTKAAGQVLTRGLARQLAPFILVNAIAPGYIDTGWISELDEKEQAAIRAETLLHRWGTPEDVAKVALFLASEDSAYMTGSTIVVDGGALLGG